VLVMFQPEPVLYYVAHFMKVAGGAAGGLIAPSRRGRCSSK
jgi:hypothetical protein